MYNLQLLIDPLIGSLDQLYCVRFSDHQAPQHYGMNRPKFAIDILVGA